MMSDHLYFGRQARIRKRRLPLKKLVSSTASLLVLLCTVASGPARAGDPIELPDNLSDAIALLKAQAPARRVLQDIGSGWVIVPTAANAAGQFGAYFKTRVSIFGMPDNATATSIPMKIYALTPTGRKEVSYTLPVGPVKTWENALAELFGYTGAAAILFDTDSVYDNLFVTAEVYTDSPNGRFSTAVETLTILDSVGSTYPDLTVGLTAGSNSRANIGCSSDSSSKTTTTASVYGAGGSKLKAFTFEIPASGWAQIPIDVVVNRGAIIWQSTGYSTYCWAVNVDNASNDGTFLGRTTYVP
jgi:hypothetical protein